MKPLFPADEKTIDAVVRNLEIIGEVAKQLPAEFKKRHSTIPSTQIAGLRNRIVHAFQTSFRSIPAQSFCKQRFRSWRFRSPSWNNEHCGGSRNSNHLRASSLKPWRLGVAFDFALSTSMQLATLDEEHEGIWIRNRGNGFQDRRKSCEGSSERIGRWPSFKSGSANDASIRVRTCCATLHERFNFPKRCRRWEWPAFRFIELDPLVHGFA